MPVFFLSQAIFLGILVVIAAIVTTVVLLVDGDDDDDGDGSSSGSVPAGSSSEGDPVTFEEALSGELRPKTFEGTWWSDEEIQTTDGDGNLILWNVATGERTVMDASGDGDGDGGDDELPDGWTLVAYAPNSDGVLALGRHDVDSVWRYSTLAYYAVYDQVRQGEERGGEE